MLIRHCKILCFHPTRFVRYSLCIVAQCPPIRIRVRVQLLSTLSTWNGNAAFFNHGGDLCRLDSEAVWPEALDGYVGPAAEEEPRAVDFGLGLVPIALLAPAVGAEAIVDIEIMDLAKAATGGVDFHNRLSDDIVEFCDEAVEFDA
jgi:hypothetical protein